LAIILDVLAIPNDTNQYQVFLGIVWFGKVFLVFSFITCIYPT
jgi:hypothetical protein